MTLETFARWVLEVVIVAGLVVVAVGVHTLLPAPFWLVGLVLVLAILAAHVLLDHYTPET